MQKILDFSIGSYYSLARGSCESNKRYKKEQASQPD